MSNDKRGSRAPAHVGLGIGRSVNVHVPVSLLAVADRIVEERHGKGDYDSNRSRLFVEAMVEKAKRHYGPLQFEHLCELEKAR